MKILVHNVFDNIDGSASVDLEIDDEAKALIAKEFNTTAKTLTDEQISQFVISSIDYYMTLCASEIKENPVKNNIQSKRSQTKKKKLTGANS